MAPRSKPPVTTVLFVRHGRTPTTGKVLPGRAKGLHLSDEGRAQAQAVGAYVSENHAVAAIYSSPLERARETAAPLAKATGLKVQATKGLLECEFGDWTGLDLVKLNRLPEWKVLLDDPARFRFPNGESLLDMQARVAAELQRIVEQHPNETIVAVSHADPIKVAVTSALRAPIGSMHRMEVAPCSVTTIQYSPTGCSVLASSAVDHLGTRKS